MTTERETPVARQGAEDYPVTVSPAKLVELRLVAFKSFRDAVLPLDPITVLTGRNSSGKSNALDGIEVLSRLASGEEIGDALDGRRESGGVRGGSAGCAPHKSNSFALGCVVESDGKRYELNVRVQVTPELRIVHESLRGPAPGVKSGAVARRDLLWTRGPTEDDTAIYAEVFNGKRGANPIMKFRDSRLLTTQIPLRISAKNRADQAVIDGANAVLTALRGVFHLDPVPHLMREYVPERAADLKRTGENISAAVAKLDRHDRETYGRLVEITSEISDYHVLAINIIRSEIGDAMMGIREGRTKKNSGFTPAREMSDGLLRFIAIATALLTSNRGLDIDPGIGTEDPDNDGVLLVIEELENGLHPSQAGRVLRFIKEVIENLSTKVVLTTHSPALLNEMTGNLNNSIIVCYRDGETGESKLSRMPQLPGYAEAMSAGRLGDIVSDGNLVRPFHRDVNMEKFRRLLGADR